MIDFDFITSDTHFGHRRIIGLAKRPFASLQEMDEVMIERWNARVGPRDVVLHLGDFSHDDVEQDYIRSVRERLNGKIIMTLGNHDNLARLVGAGIVALEDVHLWVKDKERGINYSHLPLDDFNLFDSTISVHGHTHGTAGELDAPYQGAISVNLELHDFSPIARDDFEILLQQKMAEVSPSYKITNGF